MEAATDGQTPGFPQPSYGTLAERSSVPLFLWIPLAEGADLTRVAGAGSASLADIIAEIPGYIALISDGAVDVPVRTFPLSRVSKAWGAAERGRPRVVVCRS